MSPENVVLAPRSLPAGRLVIRLTGHHLFQFGWIGARYPAAADARRARATDRVAARRVWRDNRGLLIPAEEGTTKGGCSPAGR
jgi:hypothetical protein